MDLLAANLVLTTYYGYTIKKEQQQNRDLTEQRMQNMQNSIANLNYQIINGVMNELQSQSEKISATEYKIKEEILDVRSAALQRGDREQYVKSDIEFHMALAIASKNGVIIDLFRTFSDVLLNTMNKLEKEYSEHDPHTYYHEQIYEAVKQQDAELAVKWTILNLDGTLTEL